MRKYNIAVASVVTVAVILFSSTTINNNETVAAAVRTEETVETETQTEEQTQPATEVVITEEPETEKVIPILDSIPLDEELQKWIYEYSYEAGISPYLIYAVIEKESKFHPESIVNTSREYSVGLMQINISKDWHKERIERLGVTDLTDPKQNIAVGIDYLLELFRWREGTTLEWALMAYNGGPGYADRQTANNNISDYANYVIEKSMEYEEEGEQYE